MKLINSWSNLNNIILVVALGLVALILIALVTYFALRDKKETISQLEEDIVDEPTTTKKTNVKKANFDFFKNKKRPIVHHSIQVKRLLNVLNLPVLKELAEKENIKILKTESKPIIIEKLKNLDLSKIKTLVEEATADDKK